MENLFFRIVKVFSLVVALLAIVACLGFLGYAGYNYFQPPNISFQESSVDFNSFKSELERMAAEANATNENEINEKLPQESQFKGSEIPDRYLSRLNEIEMLFINIVRELRQPPLGQEVRLRIYQAAQRLGESHIDPYLDNLTFFLKALTENIGYFKDFEMEDKRYITAKKIHLWFFQAYSDQLESEYNRIRSEELAYEARKIKAYAALPFAAGAFGAFMYFTLVLVLLAIENNTRKEVEVTEDTTAQDHIEISDDSETITDQDQA